ncbi:NADH-plastoquinone oxidoreductase subunit 7 [Tanacetum coccineum]
MTVPATRKDLMIVNMGPHHPSMHGVLRLIVTLDGEDVIDCEPILGYLHREAITVNAPEQLGNIQVPKRASYIRVIMLELSRIASHLLWLGPFMADIGAQTPFFYIFRERELIYDLFEAATGIAEYQKLITRNPIFLERVEGVGIIGGEEAINWGLSGPMLRASGIQWDLRKVDHYECYDEFDWEALEGIPGGPYENLEIRRFDRAKDTVWNEFDYRFISKKPSPTFELPKQELYVHVTENSVADTGDKMLQITFFEWRKTVFELVTSMGIRHAKAPNPLRRRQIRNEDLRKELEYFSEDYDEEHEMESRPERTRVVTPPLRTRSPRVRKQRERVVRFEEVPNREGSRTGRNSEGNRPSEAGVEENRRRRMNLPLLLEARLGRNKNGQPLQSSLTSVHEGRQSSINIGGNLPPNGLFADLTGSVTPFVRWIEDYPLPAGLKMPSHVGSYDGKGDPDNFLHLFEGAIRMQKWLMHMACHMKTHLAIHNIKQREGVSVRAFATSYTDDTLQILGLHEDQRISGFVHGLIKRNLVEHLSTDLPSTYKGLMEKTYTWIEAREVATNRAPNDRRDNFKRSRKSSRDNGRGQKSRDRFSPYPGPNHGLLSSLSKSPREILAKYYHFHEDHGHDTNQCQELRHQIEEAVKSGQLAHLVKGIKKKKEKVSDTQLGERKKEKEEREACRNHCSHDKQKKL